MQATDVEVYISRILDTYSSMIYRVAYHNLCNSHYAEDITQEVLFKLCSLRPEFSSQEHEKAWLIRVTINLCKNYNKKVNAHPEDELTPNIADSIPAPDRAAENEVLEAVMALDEKFRNVVYLFYYEGYSVAEIAQIEGKNQNTVLSLLHRARKKLKENLEGGFENV